MSKNTIDRQALTAIVEALTPVLTETVTALATEAAASIVAEMLAQQEPAKVTVTPKATPAPKAPKATRKPARKATPKATVPSMTRVIHRGADGAVRKAFIAENPRFAGMSAKQIQAYLAQHKDEIPAGWALPTGFVKDQIAKS